MPRKRKLTPELLPQIGSWVEQGLSVLAIAEKIGCTVGTLRVRCSQLGISLRRKRTSARIVGDIGGDRSSAVAELASALVQHGDGDFRAENRQSEDLPFAVRIDVGNRHRGAKEGTHLVLWVSSDTVEHLRDQAERKGTSSSRLAAMLLEKIAQDELYDAVLDDLTVSAYDSISP